MAVFIKRCISDDLAMFEGVIKNLSEESYESSVTQELYAMVSMTCNPEVSKKLSNGKLVFARSGVSKITSPWVLDKYPFAKYEIRTTIINIETDEVDFYIVYY